ncbi:MAG TPA: zinc-ribbon domain-containing protein, partial [Terriglobales bacterium]|nr:zinc-ribbon domain-containing protein [Terriglobales bacterium]
MRCPQCGSDNPPEYRFCGMCGTPLAKKEAPVPEPVSVRQERGQEAVEPARRVEAIEPPARVERVQPERRLEPVSSSLSGPSFLGLGGEPVHGNGRSDSDVSYLFDDEEARPRRTYWRFTVLLTLLIVIGGLVYLQYRKGGKSWVAPWSNGPAQTPVQASQAEQQNPPAQPAASAPPSQTQGSPA